VLKFRLHIDTNADMTEIKKLIPALKVLHTLGVSERAAVGPYRVCIDHPTAHVFQVVGSPL
jgi:hypothetical protein